MNIIITNYFTNVKFISKIIAKYKLINKSLQGGKNVVFNIIFKRKY
jgi:hypothetical protein